MMENIFLITEQEAIGCFKNENPTKEDHYDIISGAEPDFLRRYLLRLNPEMPKEHLEMQVSLEATRKIEEHQEKIRAERYNLIPPEDSREIQLYDSDIGFDENFEKGHNKKYILIEVHKDKHFTVKNPESILPTPQSKCIIDVEKVEKYSSLEFLPIDYDPFFGVRLLSFKRYNSDFFLCDERVIFEALLIKYKSFDFKPFFWSKEKIYEEVGIKKDRATKILERFLTLGIITKEVRRSFINNRPLQVNFYDLNAEKIIELLPKIFEENDTIDFEKEIRQYLLPALNRYSSSKMQ